MCYSAMVRQHAKELSVKFGVRIQLDLFEDLFVRRKNGEKIVLNKLFERQFLEAPQNESERRIAEAITGWHQDEIEHLKKELKKQEARQKKAEESLRVKATKKAQEGLRISTSKIAQIQLKIKKHQTSNVVSGDEESVFPFSYLTMLAVDENGERFIAPFRYHLRPFGQPESFDKKYGGCYNARRDNLINPFWKPLFGKRHGIILVEKFYEHVEEGQLCFKPERFPYMIVPTLWDINKQAGCPDLYSCALITTDPPPEIKAVGHDRCPVFIKEENVEIWLSPQGRSLEELYAVLDDTVSPGYSHSRVA